MEAAELSGDARVMRFAAVPSGHLWVGIPALVLPQGSFTAEHAEKAISAQRVMRACAPSSARSAVDLAVLPAVADLGRLPS